MANSKDIKVKALVDKEKNRVVFAESDGDFVDVLFSFLTIPLGRIVSLTNNENRPTMAIECMNKLCESVQKLDVKYFMTKRPTMATGCMNKLYTSVQNLDFKYFRTQECRNMLLHPRNGILEQRRRLKITIDGIDIHRNFYCESSLCLKTSTGGDTHCVCEFRQMLNYLDFLRNSSDESDPVKVGAFLKGLTRFIVTDDLQLMHPTSSSSFLLSELGVMDSSALEVREFCIGEDEVINLLKSSLVSKEALTQTLLKKNEPYKQKLFGGRSCTSLKRNFGVGEAENGRIQVKLFISKSKKIVCFAEAGEDFVDLVFSFLTIPLGHVLKQIDVSSIEGCTDNVYKSIVDLDVEYFKTGKEKEMLLNPKIAPKFGYVNQLLIGVEEVTCDVYFEGLTTSNDIRLRDPKIPTTHKEATSNGGFMAGPAMFTVTYDLNVSPISAISRVTVLNNLHVPFTDIQEHVVNVGNKEAVCLLLASFFSESALTRTFLQK